MKILKANAGAPTNFEVHEYLKSRGAGKDPTCCCLASIAPSEYKVYDYLEQTAACNQTREIINEFLGKCKNYDLAKSEILNIINIRPSSVVEMDPIIEQCEARFGESVEELVETICQILPTSQMESDDQEDTVSKE